MSRDWGRNELAFPLDRDSWVGGTTNTRGASVPNALKITCPMCGTISTFGCSGLRDIGGKECCSTTSQCPACGERVFFFGFMPVVDEAPRELEIIVFTERSSVLAIKNYKSAVDERIVRSYEAAIHAFNSKNYSASLVMAGRTLEGVFKLLLGSGSENKTLGSLVDKASQEIGLEGPLKKLAKLIKDGRNLGAHFDLETEPNKDIAQPVLELTEYLIEYYFVLPSRILAAEEELESKSAEY
ncbi:DUF4145 domain-containing protein [Rhodobacteraceae bacterium M385]|nr:DUF4145 domain-containing protein [Rhodobacteraceae bacterium M385]